MISVSGISLQFGDFYLLKDISFNINLKDRIGLVGKNGAGKTTMLRILSGQLKPDKGVIAMPDGFSVGFLPQEMVLKGDKTIIEETRSAFKDILDIIKKIDLLAEELTVRTDTHTDDYMKQIQLLNDYTHYISMTDGTQMEENIEKVLLGLGFLRTDFTRNIREFSGGWQMRVELAKLLLRKHNLLLLDEPTNHLDIDSIQWIEEYLDKYDGAVVIVSHDRALLNNVTKRTIEISLAKAFDYQVPYSEYVRMRAERKEQQLAAFTNQQKQIGDTEKFIERFRYKATKAVQVQSRIKMLDKLDRVEVDEEDTTTIHIQFPPAPRSGKVVVESEGASKKYGEKLILKDLDFHIVAGEKIAFVGRNGEGKTTLVKMITGNTDFTGKLSCGYNVSLGYFAQDEADKLNPKKTVYDIIDDAAVGDIRTKIRAILGSFLFGEDDVDKKVSVLSGGEKTRLAMARLLLKPVNLLILDEPTNHLDMRSKEVLKNALMKYNGTLIIVSHDRDFLNGLTNKVFEFRNQQIRQYIGSVYEFLNSRKMESLRELEKKKAEQGNSKKDNSGIDQKQLYQDRKNSEKELRKIKNRISEAEMKISENEIKMKSLLEQLSEEKCQTDAHVLKALSLEYSEAEKYTEKLYLQLDELHQQLEDFEKLKGE
ncbi:MAG: ATP-binding cassette domain-containing protein [Bacteroidota bacterium]